MNWKGALLAMALWPLGGLAMAQVQDLGAPIITNFGPEQYKAQSQNWVAVQDRRGVMYFGNAMGILEFDGQRWQLIPTPGKTTTRSLTSGPDGTIYYGSVGDLGYLTVSATGKVSAVSLRDAIPESERSFNDVWQVESSADGIYFLARSRIFRLHDGRISVLSGKLAPSQACVLNGTLFYADIAKGICRLEGDQVVPIPFLAGIANGKRLTLAPFGRHELLVGRISGDFRRIDLSAFWDEASQRYDTSRPAPKDVVKAFPSELDELLKDSNAYLYKLIPLGKDAFAISTVKAGILTFDRSGKIIRAINKAGGLLDNTVTSILLDRSNNLWATTNQGISHIELSVPQSVFGDRNGIDGVSISACFHNGRLYLGTFQNLLVQVPYRYSLRDSQAKFVAVNNSPSEIWQLLEVEGDLMAASGRGLFRVHGEAAYPVPGSSVSSLCLGVSRRWPGHLFLGHMGGLEVFQRNSGQWTLVGKVEGVKENIRRITEDADGDLWLSTDAKGLIRVHFSGSRPDQAGIHHLGPEHGLPGLTGLRTALFGNTLCVLTPKGLFKTDIAPWGAGTADQTRFVPELTLGKAFSDPPVILNDMVSDGKGGFVFSTSEGVTWGLPGKDGQFQVTSRPFQGLTSPDDSVYAHPNGGIWLLGRATHRVDPWVSKDYDQRFEILIRKVTAKTRRLVFEGTHAREGRTLGSLRTVFQNAQLDGEIPELPYRENALTFEFSAPFFEKPGTMKFQYLLEGFDKDWSEWGAGTFKEYTNIPEGSYRFRVQARNLYGTQGQEAIYRFRILPPWYRTVWAYLLWITGGIGLVVGIITLYTLKLRQEKDLLERLVAKRTQELRDATLTDPLTGLRNRRYITEILQNDVNAFASFKNHLIESKNNRASASGEEVFGLFLMDLDHFKQVNDTYGHDAGDQILKQFAEILRSSVRLDDAVMRVGGEEFLVVLKKTMPDYLHTFASKLLEKVAATPFDPGDGTRIQKTCSIGYTCYPVYSGDPDLLSFDRSIMVADLGMYYAKNHGRNQAVFLEEGSNIPSGEEALRKTVTSLDFALQEGHLKIGPSPRNSPGE